MICNICYKDDEKEQHSSWCPRKPIESPNVFPKTFPKEFEEIFGIKFNKEENEENNDCKRKR